MRLPLYKSHFLYDLANPTRIVDSAVFAIVSGDEIHDMPFLNLVVQFLPGYPGISFRGNVVVILTESFEQRMVIVGLSLAS